MSGNAQNKISIKDLILVFLKIGAIGFGGGVAMLALIRQNVVQRRKWITDDELSVGVAMGQMLPGPFVSNYVEYIGYQLRGLKGMTISVIAFLLPSFLAMTILSFLYFRFQRIPVLEQIFWGIKPVIAGILLWASLEIGKTNVKNWKALVIALIAFFALIFRIDVLLTVIVCGILGVIFYTKPKEIGLLILILLVGLLTNQIIKSVLATPLLESSNQPVSLSSIAKAFELFGIFFKIGAIIFGGGYASIPFIKQEVVDLRHWLSAKEFIDGVALGQVTPGPVAITATFVGYKVLGLIGALIATIGVFLPSFLLLLLLIHIYNRIAHQPLVQGFILGVKPAIVGMLFSATVFIGSKSIIDYRTAILAVLGFILLYRFKVDPLWLILGAGLLGWLIQII
ncbi:MAG: chromate efflux transporter [candidate division WOR-3 bacterium]